MGCSLPGSSVRGISQASILEWVVISFSRGSSPPRDQSLTCIAGGFFTTEPPGKPQVKFYSPTTTTTTTTKEPHSSHYTSITKTALRYYILNSLDTISVNICFLLSYKFLHQGSSFALWARKLGRHTWPFPGKLTDLSPDHNSRSNLDMSPGFS